MFKVKSVHEGNRESFDKQLEERLNWLIKNGYEYDNIKIDKVLLENSYYALIIAYKED